MGNEISHRRYWCKKFRRFERLPAEDSTAEPDGPDAPVAQPAQAGGSGGSVSPPESEKPQGAAAAGLHSKEQGRKREMASCSPPVAQGMGRSSELGEAGHSPPAINPAAKTGAPTRGRAEAAGGHPEVTRRDSPVQPAVEMGAGKVQSKQQRVKSISVSYEMPSSKTCTFCRLLEKRKTIEECKAKPGKPGSQE